MSTARRPLLALVGDQYNHEEPAHPRIEPLMPALGVDTQWIPTSEIDDSTDFTRFDGIWVVPGAPYHALQGVHRAIRFAREAKTPLLGTCGGFYSAVLEYAQNVLHLAETAELGNDLGPIEKLIIPPTCTADNTNRVSLFLREGSRLSELYGGRTEIEEILQCDYGMVQEFLDAATQGDVRFSGWDKGDAPRALEITDHPFFMACLFQPELSSTPGAVHPIVAGFLTAIYTAADLAAPDFTKPVAGAPSVDLEGYERILNSVRNDPRTRAAFANGSTFSQIDIDAGLRAVTRASSDGDIRLLAVQNVSAQPRTFTPDACLPQAQQWGTPIMFLSGAMESGTTEADALACTLEPGAVAWLGVFPADSGTVPPGFTALTGQGTA
ncbi:glutamine amidotransferase-related protein [Streptomyces gobiensis]|uniref:glutamine amidotransferase-related protein n=1 Tax=Streptomyces gobiensis TaxID=2875706 RepID=UPI001E5B2DA7|nr:hypothetical protein [Streptomyces gobiensis]UGY91634.1 hypothetical protein test1122_07790 [Streptomyces gobiensis]